MPDETRPYTRDVPLSALVEDPTFKDLFLPNPVLIKAITEDMKRRGFDPLQPIHVWKEVPHRGRHTILEGHQRVTAARRAGLGEVRVAYHEFASREEALRFAYEQQAGRRNIPREVMCLSMLGALQREGLLESSTTKDLARQLKFAPATIDRARQLLKHGTPSEILAVRDETHGLKQAYDLLRQRRGKAERATVPPVVPASKRPPVLTALRNDLAKAIDGGKIDLKEALRHARWLLEWLDGQAPDVSDDEDDDE